MPRYGGRPEYKNQNWSPKAGYQDGGGTPQKFQKSQGYQRYGGGRGERYHQDGRGRMDQHVREPQQHRQNDGKPLPLEREEIDRRRKDGLCLHCSQPGHVWRDCPVGKSQAERKHTPQRHVDGNSHNLDAGKGKSKTNSAGKGKANGKGKSKRYGVRKLDAAYNEEAEDPLNEEPPSNGSGEEPPDMA